MITLYRIEESIMRKRLRIKEAAKERGVTLSSIAKKLGIYRSNMSAIASGARGTSLKILRKIKHFAILIYNPWI